jgi:ubiquinone/menaquinone biosynthesis C-methylase UbiE
MVKLLKGSKNMNAKSDGYELTEPLFRTFSDWLAELCNIEKGMHVLDMGCGIGVSTFSILKMVGQKGKVIGVDISNRFISRALQRKEEMKIPNISFMLGKAEDLDFPNNAFDRVVSNFVLQQVNDRIKAIQEMKRVLRPGGYFGFTLPALEHYKEFREITASVLKEDLSRPPKNCIRSNRSVLQSLLKETHIPDAQVHSKIRTFRINSVDDYDVILETRGPKKATLHRIQTNKQTEIWKTILDEFKKRQREKGYLPLTIHANAIIWRKPKNKGKE